MGDERLSNPLAIRWVYLIWNEQIHYVARELRSWFGESGHPETLRTMLSELGLYGSSAQAEQKIDSLRCEAAVYRLLRDRGMQVLRLKSGGDWLADGRRVSVKSVLPLELTYRSIEHALRACQAIGENKFTRRIRHCLILGLDAVDYRTMAMVLRFIDQALEGTLDLWLRQGKKHSEATDRFRYVQTRENEILLALLDPSGDSCTIAELELEVGDHAQQFLSISDDKSAWFYEPLGTAWLESRFKDILRQVKAENRGDSEPVEAWANLLIHPRNDTWILNNISTIQNAFRAAAAQFCFPSSLCLYPEYVYRIRAPMTWSWNGGIAEEL